MSTSEQIEFKFKYIRDKKTQGFSSKIGYVTEDSLILEQELIPYRNILDTITSDNRIMLRFVNFQILPEKLVKNLQADQYIVLEIYKFNALDLERIIDRKSSEIFLGLKREKLEKEGKTNLFREETCPNCHASLDLSDLKETEFIHCRFCDAVFDKNNKIISDGETHRLCDNCGFFEAIHQYNFFNFYFFIVIAGYSTKKQYLCLTCAKNIADLTLLRNLLFVIGIPSAISNIFKIRNRKNKEPMFKNISEGNKHARNGNINQANLYYNKVDGLISNHPGFLMNKSLAYFKGEEFESGMKTLKESLDRCSNYLPSIQLLNTISSKLI